MAKKSPRRSIPQNVSNPVRRVMQKAQDLDDRRQNQIHNQVAAINRLAYAMETGEGWSYTDEMQVLHELLAQSQARAAELEHQLREQKEGDTVGKRKDAFLAGFAAGETEDDAQESWAEYKASLEDAEPAEDDADGDE